MDLLTLLGLILGIGGIVIGQFLESGEIGSLVQGTAAIIVFGGTIGAVTLSSTRQQLSIAWEGIKEVFRPEDEDLITKLRDEIISAAQLARKESVLALEKQLPKFSHPFMRSVFRHVVDGIEPSTIEEVFEKEILIEEERLNSGAKVFSDAGGFSPTIGIIGAVLGLIHVMAGLTDTAKLGPGIAVAFVATIYGIGSANLIFLPLGNKIRARNRSLANTKEMILSGALGIVKGLNPYIIREKLNAYIGEGAEKE
jgi:chemotaxis protein MotA